MTLETAKMLEKRLRSGELKIEIAGMSSDDYPYLIETIDPIDDNFVSIKSCVSELIVHESRLAFIWTIGRPKH